MCRNCVKGVDSSPPALFVLVLYALDYFSLSPTFTALHLEGKGGLVVVFSFFMHTFAFDMQF